MFLGPMIMSIISIGLIINEIFEIKFSCKLRSANKTVDSESSDELYTNNQMSDSDEYEETPKQNQEEMLEETLEETSEETSEEKQINNKCSCEESTCNLHSFNNKITECSRACSCLELNNKPENHSDMPPLVSNESNSVIDNQVDINNLREQIIN